MSKTIMELIADNERMAAEIERLTARINHTQQWYAERWVWMQHWFRTTGKDLPIADEFWSVLANGTPNANTPPTYQQQLNRALHRAEAAEAKLRALCEQEPVAWMRLNEQGKSIGVCDIWPERDAWMKGRDPVISLIPRPSMEGPK